MPTEGLTSEQYHFSQYLRYRGDLSAQELDEAVRWGLDLSARNLERPAIQPTPLDYKPRKLFELVRRGHFGVKSGKGFYDYRGRTEAEVCRKRNIKLIRMFKTFKTD